MESRKNACSCGKEKDVRAELCRECRDDINRHKPCHKCGRAFEDTTFGIRHDEKGREKRRGACKICEGEYQSKRRQTMDKDVVREKKRIYRRNNPDKARRWSFRSGWKQLGFNPDEVEAFVESKPGTCEICGYVGSFVVDHDHATGLLRGILCSACNLALGQFRDSTILLSAAIKYLEGPECAEAMGLA